MQIVLTRTQDNHLSTIGELQIAGEPLALTLEDGFRAVKVFGETRIPAGEYPVGLHNYGGMNERYAARFGPDFHHGMLQVEDVPGFTGILIHCGNLVTDTEGCILLGSRIIDSQAGGPYALSESETAYRQVYPVVAAALLAGEPVTISITDPPAA